jgi:hypothetical protein
MFSSDSGYSFGTLVGLKSGSLYRVDLDQIHYQKKSWEVIVAPAIGAEGGPSWVRRLPEQVYCAYCKAEFSAEHYIADVESSIEGVAL